MDLFNPLRRLVSGQKNRLQNDNSNISKISNGNYDLDLIWLTPQIIVMGYPSTGLTSLYRNPLSVVLSYLHCPPHSNKRYKVFNLCPRSENEYSQTAMGEGIEVKRFPWPDHMPPPLCMMRLGTEEMRVWLAGGEERVAVIHCKAGKGRSGTFALSYLLTLPPSSLPFLPLHSHSSSEEKLLSLLTYHTAQRMKTPQPKRYGISISSQRRWLGYWNRILGGDDPREGGEGQRIEVEYVKVEGTKLMNGVMWDKIGGGRIAVQMLQYSPTLTSQLRHREKSLGPPFVSFPSPPNPTSTSTPPDPIDWQDSHEMIHKIATFTQTQSPPATSATSTSAGSSTTSTEDSEVGSFVLADAVDETTPPPSTASSSALESRYLTASQLLSPISPSNDSKRLIIDPTQDLQIRFLAGKTGKKHSKIDLMGGMGSLGIVWCVPCFEYLDGREKVGEEDERRRLGGEEDVAKGFGGGKDKEVEGNGDGRWKWIVDAKDIDFLKKGSGIERIEVGFRWV